MAVTWGTLKGYIVNSLLQDPSGTKYTSSQLLTWARWACVEISYHTAELASVTYAGDGTTQQFNVPDDIIGNIETEGLVRHVTATEINTLPPHMRTPNTVEKKTNTAKRYYVYPSGKISLDFAPLTGESIVVDYFKIWTPPSSDSSTLAFPLWMEHPFAYFIGAYAQDPEGSQATSIGQWDQKIDSGNPEHNPMHKQYRFFIEQAYRLLNLAPKQDRQNWFKNANK